ncbi:MAG: hypothetical protein N5P05_004386 (plasmid) [Chroococcopsis gigantea SAG 12.99]|jgi:hypothetical protein|nr:hypothetical protein [Chroococcopsis gigantea SAG 12.99]
MLTIDKSDPISLTPDDFNPPLKREKPTVPYYWLVEEIATELGCSTRKVKYDITGRSESNRPPILKAYKAGALLLIPEEDALLYIKKNRTLKK